MGDFNVILDESVPGKLLLMMAEISIEKSGGSHWADRSYVNNVSGNVLVPSGGKALTGPMLTPFYVYVTTRRHYATMGHRNWMDSLRLLHQLFEKLSIDKYTNMYIYIYR